MNIIWQRRLFSSVKSFESIVAERYSCRSFDPKKIIPSNIIEKCLKATLRAPTAYNYQPYKAIVVNDKGVKESISEISAEGNQKYIADASHLVAFAALDTIPEFSKFVHENHIPAELLEAVREAGNHVKQDPLELSKVMEARNKVAFDNNQCQMESTLSWSSRMTAIAFTTLMYACESEGLKTILLEGFSNEKMQKLLNVPKEYRVTTMMCIGYQLKVPTFTTPRYQLSIDSKS